MKLDRNINVGGGGKYALLRLRTMRAGMTPEIYAATKVLEDAGILDWGNTVDSEFFVIRLKDKYAAGALADYAVQAMQDDPEYAHEISELADRAGDNHPSCKKPD